MVHGDNKLPAIITPGDEPSTGSTGKYIFLAFKQKTNTQKTK